MTIHDITDALVDSATLADIAKRAGITIQQARAVAGMIADLPMRTAVRVCTTAQLMRIRESERGKR